MVAGFVVMALRARGFSAEVELLLPGPTQSNATLYQNAPALHKRAPQTVTSKGSPPLKMPTPQVLSSPCQKRSPSKEPKAEFVQPPPEVEVVQPTFYAPISPSFGWGLEFPVRRPASV